MYDRVARSASYFVNCGPMFALLVPRQQVPWRALSCLTRWRLLLRRLVDGRVRRHVVHGGGVEVGLVSLTHIAVLYTVGNSGARRHWLRPDQFKSKVEND